MAFTSDVPPTAVSIADISIQLTDLADGTKAAEFSVQVLMSDGSLRVRTGDLLPHITTEQKNSLQSFMTSLRTQAVTEIL